mgnify:CR=1 FL=1
MNKRITYSFELNDKPNRFGQYKIYLRITKDRKKSRRATDICIKKNEWTDISKFKGDNWIKSREDAKFLNEKLVRIIQEAKKVTKQIETPTSLSILDAIQKQVQIHHFPMILLYVQFHCVLSFL